MAAPPTGITPAPNATPSVETVIEQARQMRQRNAEDTFRRLGRGERLNAEQLYDLLHAQTLATWWLLVDRHIQHARGGRELTPEQAVAKFVSWVSPYLGDDPGDLDTTTSVRVLGLHCEHELAVAYFDGALALIRQNAARSFLAQVKTLVPACTEQTPAHSTEQEMTA